MKDINGNKIKVLSIGNSFSRNAQTYLHKIAEADGVDMIVANLYIGGCPLELHWMNASTDNKAYLYTKTYVEPRKAATIKEALIDEEWDYVTFQQKSGYSGLVETYFPYLTNLIEYVKEYAPSACHVIHQTWAYQEGCDWEGFSFYGRSQKRMFQALKKAYGFASERTGIDMILPVGEAFQIARERLGDCLCLEDKSHAAANGCYLAGCVWYEVLTGNLVKDNFFVPEEVALDQIPILKACAHEAVSLYRNGYPK
jgi:hypothetical protein